MNPAARAQLAELLRLSQAGEVKAAQKRAQQLLNDHPHWSAAWHASAFTALAARDPATALERCERGLVVAAGDPRLTLLRAQVLLALGRVREAREGAEGLLEAQTEDPQFFSQLGGVLHQLHRHRQALLAYDRAVRLAPREAGHWYNRAAVRRFVGVLELAEADYDQALRLRPDDYEAYKNRSELRTQTRERNHVAELERLVAAGFTDWRGEVQIRYALAKEYEDLGDYARSWAQLTRGATCRRAHLSYDIKADVATVDWIIEAFPAPIAPAGRGPSGGGPVFIVGLPRSGSTLVERILSSHSEVESAGELNDWALALVDAVRTIGGEQVRSRRDLVAYSAQVDFAALGREYLRRVREQGFGERRFIDKMPLNYLYCGLILRALPEATILHVTRHPLAAGYAMYKTLFQDGYPFSYDLVEIGEYHLAYQRLMAHWEAVAPGRIHSVSYEALVNDQAGQTRRLLELCGLAWQDACLHFEANPQPSTTASAAQVRRALYRSSLDQWHHFEAGLAPLRSVLERRQPAP